MSYSPIAIKRSHVLGDLYNHCDGIENIPVYMNDKSGELIGFVDESLGHYADAYLFHLPEDICKKLSTGHFNYVFDYSYTGSTTNNKIRIVLNYIVLTGKTASA